MMYLEKFHTVGQYLRKIEGTNIGIEVKRNEIPGKIKVIGIYEIINSDIIAIFSYKQKNYLHYKKSLILITNTISIEYYIPQEKGAKTFIEIYDKDKKNLKVSYLNEHPPFIWPFEIDEDWNSVNFAYYLAEYINRVKENPNIVLFESN